MIGQVFAETQWEIARLGKFTASQIDALLTPPKSKEAKDKGELSETAKKYVRQKAAEIITGTIRQVTTFSMDWGKQYEPVALELLKEFYPNLEHYRGTGENPIFFKYSDFAGGSPDAIERHLRIVFEVKCPEDPANHVDYCLLESAEDLRDYYRDHYHQVQMNMLCASSHLGCSFMDMKGMFVSYCPIVNEPFKKLKTVLVYPDSVFYSKITTALQKAEDYLSDLIYSLTEGNEKEPDSLSTLLEKSLELS